MLGIISAGGRNGRALCKPHYQDTQIVYPRSRVPPSPLQGCTHQPWQLSHGVLAEGWSRVENQGMAVTLLVGRIAQQSCTVQDREHSAGRRNLQPLLRRKSGRKEKSGGALGRHASLSCPSSALDCAFSAAQQVDGKDKSGHCSSVFFFFLISKLDLMMRLSEVMGFFQKWKYQSDRNKAIMGQMHVWVSMTHSGLAAWDPDWQPACKHPGQHKPRTAKSLGNAGEADSWTETPYRAWGHVPCFHSLVKPESISKLLMYVCPDRDHTELHLGFMYTGTR